MGESQKLGTAASQIMLTKGNGVPSAVVSDISHQCSIFLIFLRMELCKRLHIAENNFNLEVLAHFGNKGLFSLYMVVCFFFLWPGSMFSFIRWIVKKTNV